MIDTVLESTPNACAMALRKLLWKLVSFASALSHATSVGCARLKSRLALSELDSIDSPVLPVAVP